MCKIISVQPISIFHKNFLVHFQYLNETLQNNKDELLTFSFIFLIKISGSICLFKLTAILHNSVHLRVVLMLSFWCMRLNSLIENFKKKQDELLVWHNFYYITIRLRMMINQMFYHFFCCRFRSLNGSSSFLDFLWITKYCWDGVILENSSSFYI